jgi:hydroxypyruvate isomerase
MRLSACIEMLFVAETPDVVERMRLAAEAGFDRIEFWHWRNKDIAAVDKARRELGLAIAGLLAEPVANLTDPACHDEFLAGLEQSIAVARRLEVPVLIAQAGNELPGRPRAEQHQAIIAALGRAAHLLAGTGVILALEPLNTRIDHPGYYLSSTEEGLDIVDAVARPEIRLLYDIYHSMVMGEEPSRVLAGRVDRIAHLHVADHPGRHQPGTGGLALAEALAWIEGQGYAGAAGLEFVPKGATLPAVAEARAHLAT